MGIIFTIFVQYITMFWLIFGLYLDNIWTILNNIWTTHCPKIPKILFKYFQTDVKILSKTIYIYCFWALRPTFAKSSFLIRALLLWEKVATEKKKKTGEKQGEEKEKIRIMKIVANYVITSSQPPKHRPTEMPHARAKSQRVFSH